MLLKTLEIYSPSVQFYCKPGATSLVTLPYSWRLLHHGKVRMWIVSHKRVPMGRAPYKSAKEGGWALFCFHHEKAPMSCLQQLNALENVQRNHQCLQSWVLTAHNTLNNMSHVWSCVASRAWPHQLCSSTQSNLVITFSKIKSFLSQICMALKAVLL